MFVNGIAEKTEDWQRDETGVATSAEPFAALYIHIGKWFRRI
jgi:hypothetical protein